MASLRSPNSIFFALLLVAAAQFFYYAPRLPEILAGHFGASGAGNAWQAKIALFTIELAMIVLATLLGFGIPRLIGAMPIAIINLPNKDFWLSPEHREETFAFLRMQFAWFGCALLVFFLVVMELVFRANLQSPPRLNTAVFAFALVAFLVFMGVWTIRLIARFARTD